MLSSVGLLVGGIGVMNIMVVSVTRAHARDRSAESGGGEGKRYRDPVSDEAAALTGLGGIAGFIFGWAISLISRLHFTSGDGALVGGGPWHCCVRGRRTVLRHLAGEQDGEARSSGRAALRISCYAVRGKIVLTPKIVIDRSKFPNADDEYTPAQRRIIDARLAESDEGIRQGRTFGPFNSAEEMVASMKAQLKKRATATRAKSSRR